MKSVTLGAVFYVVPGFLMSDNGDGKPLSYGSEVPGTVIYIHPKGRFAVLRLDIGGHHLTEAFRLEQLIG